MRGAQLVLGGRHGASQPCLPLSGATAVSAESDEALQQRARARARTKLLQKVRSHHGLGSATLAAHTRATDTFLAARDEAARLHRPQMKLPVHGLAPIEPRGPSRIGKRDAVSAAGIAAEPPPTRPPSNGSVDAPLPTTKDKFATALPMKEVMTRFK